MMTATNPSHWQVFSTAIQFLTRIPVKGAMGHSADFYYTALRRSVVFFPVIGGLIGLFTSLVGLLAVQIGLSPWLAAGLAIAAEATLTGAFHEDAFADTWDALGGGWTREQVLEIMKDSRLGTYGTMGLILGVGIRGFAMAELLEQDLPLAIFAMVAAACIARIAIVAMMATTDPITDRNSQAKDVSGTQTGKTLVWATLISSPFWLAWVFVRPTEFIVATVVSIAILVWFRRKLLKRIGGTTGDTLGCSAYLTQLVFLVVATRTP
ncbi:MAG: adenosylcobinamide-GDP ribazoletransferase [Planctomycetota bacterium]